MHHSKIYLKTSKFTDISELSHSFCREEDDKLERYVEDLVLKVCFLISFQKHSIKIWWHDAHLRLPWLIFQVLGSFKKIDLPRDGIQEKEKQVDVFPIVKAKRDLQLGRLIHSPAPIIPIMRQFFLQRNCCHSCGWQWYTTQPKKKGRVLEVKDIPLRKNLKKDFKACWLSRTFEHKLGPTLVSWQKRLQERASSGNFTLFVWKSVPPYFAQLSSSC